MEIIKRNIPYEVRIRKAIKKKLAKGFLVVEMLEEDSPLIPFRLKKCMGNEAEGIPPCMFYDFLRDECKSCGCIIEDKVKTKTQRDRGLGSFTSLLSGGEITQTHCPEGRWNDKTEANFYRKKKGQPLIK